MNDGSNRAEHRLCAGVAQDTIRSVSNLHAYYAHGYKDRIGEKGKPRQTEESDGVFAVHIESDNTENEEKDSEGQSNGVHKIDTTDKVAVANQCSLNSYL